VKRLAGPGSTWVVDDCPRDVEERFWANLLAFERDDGPPLFDQLLDGGVSLPPPREVGAEALHAKLWEVIQGLALLGVYLYSTNHLDDRALYEILWRKALREPSVTVPEDPVFGVHIDLVMGGGEEETANYLRYYADDETRLQWAKEFPDFPMPRRKAPPFDRDRHLPRPVWKW
jgi:hypothetical protein